MNMFWVDDRMIIDYGQFGDVVSFDTTFKINKVNQNLLCLWDLIIIGKLWCLG